MPEEAPPPHEFDVVVVTGDLMIGSRVAEFARSNGLKCRQVLPGPFAADPPSAACVCIDLSAQRGPLSALLEKVAKPAEGGPRVVAFGPHVQEELLQSARDFGVSEVLTRGQFLNQLGRWLPAAQRPAGAD